MPPLFHFLNRKNLCRSGEPGTGNPAKTKSPNAEWADVSEPSKNSCAVSPLAVDGRSLLYDNSGATLGLLLSLFPLHVILSLFFFVQSVWADEVTPADAAKRGEAIRRRWPAEQPIDVSALLQSGVRRLEGKHIILYTDTKNSEQIDLLPKYFDRLIPLLCDYFQLDGKDYENFRVEAFLIDDFEKFKSGGAVRQVPNLRNGYALRRRIWLREQQSDYYRRHLLLHEGIHAFMGYAFGDWGPPWYREGMAELLATHRIDDDGRLRLGYFPKKRRELEHWGRIENVQEATRNNSAKSMQGVFGLESEDYDANSAYAWSWAFAAFCENHPSYGKAFRRTAWKLGGPPTAVLSICFSKSPAWPKPRPCGVLKSNGQISSVLLIMITILCAHGSNSRTLFEK